MRTLVVRSIIVAVAFAGRLSRAEEPPKAPDKQRIAVLILGAGADPTLADNLTEVLITRLSKQGTFDIAGKEEFAAKLGVNEERRALACVEELACIMRAGAALGVTSVLAGTIGRRGPDYLFSLTLTNLLTSKTENQYFRLVTGGAGELIRV